MKNYSKDIEELGGGGGIGEGIRNPMELYHKMIRIFYLFIIMWSNWLWSALNKGGNGQPLRQGTEQLMEL